MATMERKEHLKALKDSQLTLENTLEGMDSNLFSLKSTTDTWSIAEILEHIMMVETGVINNLKRLGGNAGVHPQNTPLGNSEVIEKSQNRDTLVNAPEMFIPKGTFKGLSVALKAFQQHRKKIEIFVSTTQIPLKNIAFPHPRLGLLNGENWLAFIAGHCLRHVVQIKQIIAAQK